MTTDTSKHECPSVLTDDDELNKKEFETVLGGIFTNPVLECRHGRLLVPGEEGLATYKEFIQPPLQEQGEELFSDSYHSKSLMRFLWDSGMPCTWDLDLNVLSVKSRVHYLYLTGDVMDECFSNCRIIARIEGKLTDSFLGQILRTLLHRNGKEFHVGFFGSLPSETITHDVNLIRTEVVKQVYREWMNHAVEHMGTEQWTELAASINRESEPSASHTLVDVLRDTLNSAQDVGGLEAYTTLQRLKNNSLSQSEKQDIFDQYFEEAYKVEG